MAFADTIKLDGIGWVWLVDVSFDNFATVSYRWSDFSCRVGSNNYQARIPERGLSKLQRGFGQENTMQAGTVTMSLENTDFAMDWLVDRATYITQTLRARFRITLLVYPNSSFASYQTKVMGTFKCINPPSRDRERVTVQLVDDTMGLFDQVLTSPTIREWRDDVGSTVDTNPLHESFVPIPAPNSDWDTPLPLAFGQGGRLNAFCAAAAYDYGTLSANAQASSMRGMRVIPICATTSAADVTPNDVKYLWGVYGEDVMIGLDKWEGAGSTIAIPRQFTIPNPSGNSTLFTPGTYTIWEPMKSQVLTKDGASWRILWVKFDVGLYSSWFQFTRKIGAGPNGNSSAVGYLVPQAPAAGQYSVSDAKQMAAFTHFQVKGWPFSARTSPQTEFQFAPDVVRDLVVYYSRGSASDFDETRYATARQICQVHVNGVVLPQRPVTSRFTYSKSEPPADALSDGQLRRALSDIAQSADLDVAMTWEGKIAVHSSYFTFANLTATRVTLRETDEDAIIESIPSKGERWAPYNSLYVLDPSGTPHGPFDNPHPDAVAWGVKLERTLQGKWRRPFVDSSDATYSRGVWYDDRRVESVVRPVVRFIATRDALQLDLGDLFNFKWTRNGTAGPYNTTAVFRVEGIYVDPEDLIVGIEAVWVDDLTTVKPYLLDLEALTVRVASSAGRIVSVTDSQTELTFSSGDLVAEGVEVGDVVVLMDATQGVNTFSRFRCLRVSEVISVNELRTDDADLDFGAPAGASVATWEIRRGATTYPDSSSDPVNYPSDGDMYGKACGDTDIYSDSSAANLLL